MKARTRERRVYRPRYRRLLDSGLMPARVDSLKKLLTPCRVCPRTCGANRDTDEEGFCRTGGKARVASVCLHRGEEPPLSGTNGSGAVFYAGCNLSCVYCQNHQISQKPDHRIPEWTAEQLASELLNLQNTGAHNINFVSPSHVLPQMADAIFAAAQGGLSVPVVFNSNGYESVSSLRLLDDFVDVYLPDLKYADVETAQMLSNAPDYPSLAASSIQEMYRQVGPLKLDANGLAVSGVIVRHLVLPGRVTESMAVLRTLALTVGTKVTLSIMAQYYPAHKAGEVRGMDRPVTVGEYSTVLDCAVGLGFEDVWTQETTSSGHYCPDFQRAHPFEA